MKNIEAFQELKKRQSFSKSKLEAEIQLAHNWLFAEDFFKKETRIEIAKKLRHILNGKFIDDSPSATCSRISTLISELELKSK